MKKNVFFAAMGAMLGTAFVLAACAALPPARAAPQQYEQYVVPAPVASAPVVPPDTDFEVTQNKDGKTLTISGYKGAAKNIIIPEKLWDTPVTVIGRNAFAGKDLTGVVVPDSVTTIETEAFKGETDRAWSGGRPSLISVTIGNSVTTIGSSAFEDNNLTSVIIPDSVITIGARAFRNNLLTSVTIGNSVKTIGEMAFISVDNAYSVASNKLTSVVIPDSVITIAKGAFKNNQLTSLILGKNVTTIGGNDPYYPSGAFENNKLTSVTIPDSVITIEQSAFKNNQLTSLVLGKKVITIEGGGYSIYTYGAFENNQLTSVTIPDNVTTIGMYAFSGNPMTTLSLGRGLRRIEHNTFRGNQLTSITIAKDLQQDENASIRFAAAGFANLGTTNIGISTYAGFEESFLNFYTSQNRTPGTYVKNGPIWSKK